MNGDELDVLTERLSQIEKRLCQKIDSQKETLTERIDHQENILNERTDHLKHHVNDRTEIVCKEISDVNKNIEKQEDRIRSLEKFKNKLVGIALLASSLFSTLGGWIMNKLHL